MKFAHITLVLSAVAALSACGAHDHQTTGDVAGPADQKSLDVSVNGEWEGQCQNTSRSTIFVRADGTCAKSVIDYAGEGCTGQSRVASRTHYTCAAEKTATAVGRMKMTLKDTTSVKTGDTVEQNVRVKVSNDGKTMILRCESARLRLKASDSAATGCDRGVETYTRVVSDWE